MSTEKRSIVQFDLVVDGSSPLGISNLHFDIPLSLWYFQYWKSIWKQHDNDCLPLLKWDVKPLSHCCLSCLRSFNQFSEFHQKAKLETRPCCLMFLRSASVVVTIARWHLRHRAAAERAESLAFNANRGAEGVVSKPQQQSVGLVGWVRASEEISDEAGFCYRASYYCRSNVTQGIITNHIALHITLHNYAL